MINEAVELAKEYGGTDGHKYVNGVLDKLVARAAPRRARSRRRPAVTVRVRDHPQVLHAARADRGARHRRRLRARARAPRHDARACRPTCCSPAATSFPDADPASLGHKSLAVNLSDLAAIGADPRWALLAIALPKADRKWIAAFASGFFRLAAPLRDRADRRRHHPRPARDLDHGDRRGAAKLALRRDAARAGDDVWLSGATGEAALGLAHLEGRVRLSGAARSACLRRLHAPEPRVKLGRQLRGVARGAIDVSDGLLADLGHIARASRVAAELRWEDICRAPGRSRNARTRRSRRTACSPEATTTSWYSPRRAPRERRSRRPEEKPACRSPASAPSSRAGPRCACVMPEGGASAASRAGFDHFA